MAHLNSGLLLNYKSCQISIRLEGEVIYNGYISGLHNIKGSSAIEARKEFYGKCQNLIEWEYSNEPLSE